MFPRDEIIEVKRWNSLCDYRFTEELTEFPLGIIQCDIQQVPILFDKIQHLPDQYTIISAESDFGICYQNEFPPCRDLAKHIELTIQDTLGYKGIQIGGRLNHDLCSPEDKFSIKCWSYTYATFNKIPSNVRWFVANCSINETNVTAIPFGLNGEEALNKISSYLPTKRTKLLYLNFRFTTTERVELYKYYVNQPWCTIKDHTNYDEYLQDLSEHYFCMCPIGNGIDSYRIWESLYMGCYPVVKLDQLTASMTSWNLPIAFSYNLLSIDPDSLSKTITELSEKNRKWMQLSNWKDFILAKEDII